MRFSDLIFDGDFPYQFDLPLPFLNRFSKLNLLKLESVRAFTLFLKVIFTLCGHANK